MFIFRDNDGAKDKVELKTMTTSQDEDDEDDDGDEDRVDVITLNNIKDSVRFALLMSMGILSTYICTVLIIVDISAGISKNIHIYTWTHVFLGVDIIVNSTVLYLMFTFTTREYNKFCRCCHGCMEKCCINCMLKCGGNKGGGVSGGQSGDSQQYANLILSEDAESVR